MTRRRDARRAQAAKRAAGRRRVSGLELLLVVCAVVGTVAGVLALVPSDAPFGSGDSHGPVPPRHTGRLELDQWVVRNGDPQYRAGGIGGVQTRASMPTVGLTLLNRDRERVLLVEARIAIEAYAEFPICFSQGAGPLPVSPPYVIDLPSSPRPSEPQLVDPLHEQVGPDEADRIELLFAAPEDRLTNDFMYLVHVTLRTSDRRHPTIDAGRYLLGTPGPLDWNTEKLPVWTARAIDDFFPDRISLEVSWCYRRNLAQLRHMLALPGRRSHELRALDEIVPSASWAQKQNLTPARAAAEQLLHAGGPSARGYPEVALFAAQQTGDDAFVAQIRTQAARELLDTARRAAADGSWALALSDARASLAIDESAGAAQLAAEAERRSSRPERGDGADP